MIHLGSNRWIRPEELTANRQGREDTPEIRETCVAFLEDRDEWRPDVAFAKRAKAHLASAQILKLVAPSHLQDTDLLKRLSDAEKTIDRLLAFVPARAPLIAQTRLDELSSHLARRAAQLFPEVHQISSATVPEDESDTEACHRLTIKLDLPDADPDLKFASRMMLLHRAFAELATVDERRALRLIVQPSSQL